MARYARIAQYFLIAVLLYAGVTRGWRFVSDGQSLWDLTLSLWLFSAIVGLHRQVAWGRFFASCFSMFVVFSLAARIVTSTTYQTGPHILLNLMNLPLPLAWLCVVAIATLTLTPVFLIGIKKEWFRDEWW